MAVETADSIIMSEVMGVDNPILRNIAKRVVHMATLAAEKVVVSEANEKEFPFPAEPDSFEQILKARFKDLPKEKKEIAKVKALQRVNAKAAIRQKAFKDLEQVNLRSAVPIEKQVEAMGFSTFPELTPEMLQGFIKLPGTTVPSGGSLPAARTADKLELRIHRVKCIDETNGFLGSEAGSDEIDLGATTVDETGDTKQVAAFRVKSFKEDGDEKVYSPPKPFTIFSLREGTEFPKSYLVTFVLAEKDNGGLPDFVQKLYEKVKEKVTIAAAAQAGSKGGPLGIAIAVAVSWAVNEIFEKFKEIWEDDIFPPKTVRVTIPSLGARWPGNRTDSPEKGVIFKGHGGEYSLTYDWRVFG